MRKVVEHLVSEEKKKVGLEERISTLEIDFQTLTKSLELGGYKEAIRVDEDSQTIKDIGIIEAIIHKQIENILNSKDSNKTLLNKVEECLALVGLLDKYRGAKLDLSLMKKVTFPGSVKRF